MLVMSHEDDNTYQKVQIYMAHCGYDKLKAFGFCIHGAIDGYSGHILWLEVGSSNNDPLIIATFYYDCVKRLGGAPHICRADADTENVHLSAMQRVLRRSCSR